MQKRVRGQQAAASAAGASGRTSATSSALLACGEELLPPQLPPQQQHDQFLEGGGVHFAYLNTQKRVVRRPIAILSPRFKAGSREEDARLEAGGGSLMNLALSKHLFGTLYFGFDPFDECLMSTHFFSKPHFSSAPRCRAPSLLRLLSLFLASTVRTPHPPTQFGSESQPNY